MGAMLGQSGPDRVGGEGERITAEVLAEGDRWEQCWDSQGLIRRGVREKILITAVAAEGYAAQLILVDESDVGTVGGGEGRRITDIFC